MEVGAAFSALTLLILPSLAKINLPAQPAITPAPLLVEASNPSIRTFWSTSLTLKINGENDHSREDSPARIAEGAVATWNELLGTPAFTSSGEDAAITVVFCPDLTDRGSPVAGLTSWSRTKSGQLHALLRLRTKTRNGRTMPSLALRQAALHELGHALGLDDNSKGGVMRELDIQHPVTSPSAAEVFAVKKLRADVEFEAYLDEEPW